MPKDDATLLREITALKKLTVAALREKYREVFGEETNSHNKAYLFKRIAYRLQEKEHGGLKEAAKAKAQELAKDAPIRRRPKLKTPATEKLAPAKKRDPRLPAPGSVLKKTYKDATLSVKVLGTASSTAASATGASPPSPR